MSIKTMNTLWSRRAPTKLVVPIETAHITAPYLKTGAGYVCMECPVCYKLLADIEAHVKTHQTSAAA
jgi:hypothetical protein